MSSIYKELYKKGVDSGEQQRKRQLDLLKQQRLRRQHDQDGNRVLPAECFDSPAKLPHRKNKQKQRDNYTGSDRTQLRWRLQLSEWLRHTPDELTDWLLVPCPIGKRCLVVASHGKTKVYSKAGWQIMKFQTMLPGDGQQGKCTTVLDCIYVENMDTFFVLDAIAFGLQDLQECDANFRFYWLRTRFNEYPVDLGQCRDGHEKAFILLKHNDFNDLSVIEDVLQNYPIWEENQPQLDGFLFYHKEASYECGTTPLVCWLFAYMLPDLLGLEVNENYKPPQDYQKNRPLEYMDEFDRKLQEQRKKANQSRESKHQLMKIDPEPTDEQSDEDTSLKTLMDHQRRLELSELDMDCSEPTLSPTTLQPSAAATAAASVGC